MGTFVSLPRISAAIGYNGQNAQSGNRNNAIVSCASDEYAIVKCYYHNASAGAVNINFGFSSETSFNAASAGTVYHAENIAAARYNTFQDPNAGYSPDTLEIYVGPGQTLYWGASGTVNQTYCRAMGVKFKNA